MRTWWQLLRQRGLLGAEPLRGRRGAGSYISDRALRLGAEVLEPRCLLTDAMGLAADDGGGDILVDASQWDDAGMTLLRDGDLVHLVRTGTTQDVIAPFAAAAPGQLIIQGRDDASDVLTIDLCGLTYITDTIRTPMLLTKELCFVGGDGIGIDELRFSNSQKSWNLDTYFQVAANNNSSIVLIEGYEDYHPGMGRFVSSYQQVELVTQPFGQYTAINFGTENNVINIDENRPQGLALVSDETLGISIQFNLADSEVFAGAGDDRITVESSVGNRLNAYGGNGNDTLFGSDGYDDLIGGEGNDWIDGRGGNAFLTGGCGNWVDEWWGGGDDTVIRGYANDSLLGGGGSVQNVGLEISTVVDEGDAIPNVSQTLIVPPSANTLLEQDDNIDTPVDEGDAIPNATQTLIVPPPANTLLGQGLDEPRDADVTLPQTLVTDAESDGEDSGLNELEGQESNPADENDSTETAATTWDDLITNPLLAHDAEK